MILPAFFSKLIAVVVFYHWWSSDFA